MPGVDASCTSGKSPCTASSIVTSSKEGEQSLKVLTSIPRARFAEPQCPAPGRTAQGVTTHGLGPWGLGSRDRSILSIAALKGRVQHWTRPSLPGVYSQDGSPSMSARTGARLAPVAWREVSCPLSIPHAPKKCRRILLPRPHNDLVVSLAAHAVVVLAVVGRAASGDPGRHRRRAQSRPSSWPRRTTRDLFRHRQRVSTESVQPCGFAPAVADESSAAPVQCARTIGSGSDWPCRQRCAVGWSSRSDLFG